MTLHIKMGHWEMINIYVDYLIELNNAVLIFTILPFTFKENNTKLESVVSHLSNHSHYYIFNLRTLLHN